MAHPYFEVARPAVFAHRGASGELPENTLAAFALALQQGAHYLETDVHLSRDGQAVISHDADVARCTDGAGRIAELPWPALQKLDAGYRFTRDGGAAFPQRGRGHRLPLLEELFARFPQARFNVELKSAAPALAAEVVRLIAAHGRAPRTLLAAADDAAMRGIWRARERSGCAFAVGASTGDVAEFVRAARAGSAPPARTMVLQIPPRFGDAPLATPALIKYARARGVAVHVWTINDADEMRRMLELDVDGVMSDYPGRLRDVIAVHRRGREAQ